MWEPSDDARYIYVCDHKSVEVKAVDTFIIVKNWFLFAFERYFY